ncbi:MAG: type II toxin-antitoxin system HicA family toxin [Candidatus Eremiobacteraeota bacterium]|nr:type II toxin-antitoxin system HicA family toxin [Candidatus Eremiobacteraeota bacterium]MBV8459391.1 type II toxin-antitoxin system HicA family toxin [Candidatus Eremiobacteraeota bacterium]
MVRVLQRIGFVIARQQGSHVLMRRGSLRTVIPMHAARDIPKGTLARILRDINLTADELRDLL